MKIDPKYMSMSTKELTKEYEKMLTEQFPHIDIEYFKKGEDEMKHKLKFYIEEADDIIMSISECEDVHHITKDDLEHWERIIFEIKNLLCELYTKEKDVQE